MPVVFLNAGVSSFPDPGNWNPVNKVEVLGAGGAGGNSFAGNGGAGGGGGGSYAYMNNMMPPWPAPCYIADGSRLTGTASNFGVSNQFPQTSGNVVSANNGDTGNNGAPQFEAVSSPPSAGAQLYPAGFTGGGVVSIGMNVGGSGGSGAAGPTNGGGLGSTAGLQATAYGPGGFAHGNTTTTVATPGGPGRSGTEWDASHGCGSGGCGGNNGASTKIGGKGANYGGGSGGNYSGSGAGVNGGEGLIVLTYTPYIATPIAIAMVIS
jgi:hypothetical protein